LKRVKRRYLALQIEAERVPSEREFIDAVWSSVVQLYGEFGASQTSLALISYNVESNSAVIRTGLAALDMVRASIALITALAGSKASVHILAVSGTIKSLRPLTLQRKK
jgi:ribonuclease P/MRP protein subunit POP5